MRARTFLTLVTLTVGLGLGAGASQAQEVTTAQATLHPVNQSGTKGEAVFVETSTGVQVSATATGLQPSAGRYISLVYDRGSAPGGPLACEPTDDSVGFAGMFVGTWDVDSAGNGTLIQVNPAVASLTLIDSMSIRDRTVNDGMGPEAVVACGEIAVRTGR